MIKVKNTFKAIALCLCLTLMCGMFAVPAFADEVDTPADDPVVNSMVYTNRYTYGASSGSFDLTSSSTVRKYTVETQDFPSNSYITVAVYKGNTQVSETGVLIAGNGKVSNQTLVMPYTSGTYTIHWTVSNGGSGWIGVWLF